MKLLHKDTLLSLGMFHRLMSLSGQSLVSCANSGTLTYIMGSGVRWVDGLLH